MQVKIQKFLAILFVALMLSSCSSQVKMPSVIGDESSVAKSAITELNLESEPLIRYETSLEPEGIVISATPSAGEILDPDSTITLVVSSGPDAFVPDLIGYNTGYAKAKLSKLSLNYSIESVYSDTVGKGLIISTSPSAGDPILFSSSVSIVVSKGREPTLLEGAYQSCGYPDVDLTDNNMTIIVDTPGDLFMSAGLRPNYDDVFCLLDKISTPEYIKNAIENVRAIDGRQTQEFGNISLSFSYHPDSGLDLTIHDNG